MVAAERSSRNEETYSPVGSPACDQEEVFESVPFSERTAVGSVIGPYTLLELIGEGGVGEVWLAEQRRSMGRRVAIKLIKTSMKD
jgi:serine/threonine protein kinase